MKFQYFRGNNSKVVKGDNPTIGGAQQLMLNNIPIKFEDSRSYGCRVRHAAKLVIIYVIFQGQQLKKYQRENNPKIEGAQQLMLGNITVKIEDSRSNGC